MGLLGNQTPQQYYTNEAVQGNYQFTSLKDIINHFIISHVGEDKIISKVKRSDVIYHAKRAMQELSFDTFKSCKSMEVSLSPSLQMVLPQDYVNWTKISWVDSAGIKHRLYPTNSKTSNPFNPQYDSDGDFIFDKNGDLVPSGNLITNSALQGSSSNQSNGFILNKDITGTTGTNPQGPVFQSAGTTASPITDSTGWFFDNNKIIGYNLIDGQGFTFGDSYPPLVTWPSLHIEKGAEYKLTYTLSGYSSGTYEWVITDENQDHKFGTQRTANGTYTDTFDLSTGMTETNTFAASTIGLRQTGSTLGNVTIDNITLIRVGDEDSSETWGSYSSSTPSENNNDDYEDNVYWKLNDERYGLDPQHAQVNGSFYVDCDSGKIHFSSNVSGKTIVLDYLSDGLGTDEEMRVHKFAEEAMYKHIAYGVLSTRINTPEYLVQRFKKERFAETRKAKLRLSNIKLEELTQILRGKSKHIKH
tara:strand:+ start:859 stop:2277 length:1419 start_codon:yes stop_codon:yes gene_type:complete